MNKRLLVIRFSSLGDLILASAPIINLRLGFPEHEIILLTKERMRPIAEMIPGLDSIITVPDSAGTLEYSKILIEIRNQGIDIVVDLHGNPRSWLASSLLSALNKASYPKRRVERFVLTRKRKTIPEQFPHTIDLYNEAVKQLDVKTPCRRPVMKPPGVALRDWFRSPYVVIAPGAAHETKRWSISRFEDVALSLAHNQKLNIVWAVAGTDVGKTQLNAALTDDRFVEMANAEIGNLADVIAGAEVTVANDSGIAHLSSAVGTPVVAVFGPTHPALGFSPRGLLDEVIGVEESCRPCSLHGKKPCYRESQFCFERIESETVAAVVARLATTRRDSVPALFIDRDGTLIIDKDYLHNPDDVELIAGASGALKLAQEAGYKLVVVTNQSGVARGYFSEDDVDHVNQRLLQLLAQDHVEIDGIYYCPHHADGKVPEFTRSCDCRKPAVGMAEEAALHLGIDLHKSIMIGDKPDDFYFGIAFGGESFLVRTGYGNESEAQLSRSRLITNDRIFDDLGAAVRHIIQR